MYACPHCSSASISAWRKFNATPFFPAHCRACGGESMASGWGRATAAFGAEALLWGSILFAIFIGSFYGLLALPFSMLALSVLVNRAFPLVALDAGLAKARRRAIRNFAIAVAVAIAVLVVQALI
jgi:hypothetical protein